MQRRGLVKVGTGLLVSQPILLLLLWCCCNAVSLYSNKKYALSAQVATSHVTKGWTTV